MRPTETLKWVPSKSIGALVSAGSVTSKISASISAPAAWASDNKVWFQLFAVVGGLAVIAVATIRIPGVSTRPGAYLSGALIAAFVAYRFLPARAPGHGEVVVEPSAAVGDVTDGTVPVAGS